MALFSSKFVRDDIRKVLEKLQNYFKSFYSYPCTLFNVAAVRELQDEQTDGSYLRQDGSNFVNVFLTMMEQDATFKMRYLGVVKKLVFDCEDIDVKHAGSKIWMELKLAGEWFSLAEVSDGTVHLLLILLLLVLPEKKGISMLAFDEPEMNLHPAWQKLLAKEILQGKSFKQCFISTHSPDFLDEFTEDFLQGNVNIIVFDPASNIPVRQLNRDALRQDLTEWTIGDLYRVGDPMIGGWPQ